MIRLTHNPMIPSPIRPIYLIIALYLVVGTLYAVYTPAWQAPDEPAHYNYVRQLADGRFPIIESGDYDQEYIVTAVFENQFAPQYPIEPLSYEDWQPPLYYLLQTPIFWLSDGNLTLMRLFSLLLGAGVIAFAYACSRLIFPQQEWLALTTAVFIAFIPQHISIMASLNNDSLAELIIAIALWHLLKIADPRLPLADRHLIRLGLVMGLGFLTKGTVYPLALLVALVVLWRLWGDWTAFFRAGLLIALPAGLLGSLWWGRNLIIYGGLDFMAKAAHDAVVVGQPRTADWVAQMGWLEVIRRFGQTTFNSFWGQFGWMTVPLPLWAYRILLLFTAVVIIGWGLNVWPGRNGRWHPQAQHLTLLGLFLLTLAVHIGYNLTFVQHQGRYLFPALIPIGVAVTAGLGGWVRLLDGQRPPSGRYPQLRPLIPLGLGTFLLALSLFALFRVLIPAFA